MKNNKKAFSILTLFALFALFVILLPLKNVSSKNNDKSSEVQKNIQNIEKLYQKQEFGSKSYWKFKKLSDCFKKFFGENKNINSIGSCLNEPVEFNCGDLIQDIDGNIYETISINDQCWMKESLKTTKYNNGVSILNLISQQDWASTNFGAYVCYNNNSSNCDEYGALYNFYAVEAGNLCPVGWRVPTRNDFESLMNSIVDDRYYTPHCSMDPNGYYCGGSWSEGGYEIKDSVAWNDNSNNVSEFKIIPGGFVTGEEHFGLNISNRIWTSSVKDISSAPFFLRVDKSSSLVEISYNGPYEEGNSVRCIKK